MSGLLGRVPVWAAVCLVCAYLQAITPMLRKVAAMPFFVLCSKVCPEKCEATLFALLMALSNFGGDLGR